MPQRAAPTARTATAKAVAPGARRTAAFELGASPVPLALGALDVEVVEMLGESVPPEGEADEDDKGRVVVVEAASDEVGDVVDVDGDPTPEEEEEPVVEFVIVNCELILSGSPSKAT